MFKIKEFVCPNCGRVIARVNGVFIKNLFGFCIECKLFVRGIKNV
jgi:predicted RNA-binding Zn-ribbon protein involved in translation (DUF1610 family)